MTVYIMDGFETYGDKTTAGSDVQANINATTAGGDGLITFTQGSGGHGGDLAIVDDHLAEGFAVEFPPFDTARSEWITYSWPSGSGRFPDKIVSTNSSAPILGCGFRFYNADWTVASGSPTNIIWQVMNSVSAAGAKLTVMDDKTTLRFTDSDSISYDASSALTAGQWHYIELEWKQTTKPNGYVKVSVDGTVVIDESDIDMSGFTFFTTYGFRIGLQAAGSNQTNTDQYKFDDVYGMEIDGVDHTGLLGDCRVKLLKPNSDATPNDWTRSTGADNFGRVDVQDWDTTEYVDATSTGDDDHYGLETLGSVDTVHAVRVDAVVEAVDGTPTLHIGLDDGTADEADMGTIGTGSAVQKQAVFNEDPSGAAWTQSAVNSVEATQRMTE
jgi:hypothetical protein